MLPQAFATAFAEQQFDGSMLADAETDDFDPQVKEKGGNVISTDLLFCVWSIHLYLSGMGGVLYILACVRELCVVRRWYIGMGDGDFDVRPPLILS